MLKCLIIAKNEVLLKTNKLRNNRVLFFISIYSILLFWALFLGPNLLDIIIPDIVKRFATRYKKIFLLKASLVIL